MIEKLSEENTAIDKKAFSLAKIVAKHPELRQKLADNARFRRFFTKFRMEKNLRPVIFKVKS